MEHHALSQIPPTEVSALLEITPQKFNPAMAWKESCHIERRLDDAHAVLSCRAEKEVAR